MERFAISECCVVMPIIINIIQTVVSRISFYYNAFSYYLLRHTAAKNKVAWLTLPIGNASSLTTGEYTLRG